MAGYRAFELFLLAVAVGRLLWSTEFEKQLRYDRYTLDNEYVVNGKKRQFQWGKMSNYLDSLEGFSRRYERFGMLCNYKNINGHPPLVDGHVRDEYNSVTDVYGTERSQSIPLYMEGRLERYGRDGALVGIVRESGERVWVSSASFGGEWEVPKRYVRELDTTGFVQVVFVDKTNQNITLMERRDTVWVVLSMNPASTGVHRPPYKRETPTGIYVVQGRSPKMFFYRDGTTEVAGFSPYATRFTRGAYIHGVPVNYPQQSFTEYSSTLGTVPRTHMCVRNATSHARFVYEWAKEGRCLVMVME